MGIIQTQTIKGTIYSYLGIGIGFVITAILFPRILSTEEIGLIKLLVSFSVLFAQLSSLGFINVINRLFPYFRDKESGHNGILLLGVVFTLAGFILSIAGLEIFKPVLIENNADNSFLFLNYVNYLVPLIFFTAFFNLFDSYIKALYNAVVGTVLKELIQRVFILGGIVFFYLDLVNFHQFVLLYTAALSLPTLILLFILFRKGEIKIKLPPKSLFKLHRKEILDLCAYGLLIGFGGIAIIQIDSILVNKFLGLSLTGIYATNFFFATIILIPSRPLIKIATTILAEAWKRNDLKEIQLIYQKSSINQAVIGILIFIGLWVNIDNIYILLGDPEFEAGKWVIFFVGLANVFDMFTGINAVIIQTSSYFRINAIITFIFLFLIVAFNLILIPLMGITGAGIAGLIAVVVTNSIRFFYLKVKFGLSPFHPRLFIIIVIAGFSYLIAYIIPVFDNYIIDIIIRSSLCGGLFMALIIVFGVSEEINSIFNTFREKLNIKPPNKS